MFSSLDFAVTVINSSHSKFISEYSSHPLAQDLTQKAEMFDQYAANYAVPPQITQSA